MSDKKFVHVSDIDRCGATGKIRFKSYGQAMHRGREILEDGDKRKFLNSAQQFTAYKCQFCSGHHLASYGVARG